MRAHFTWAAFSVALHKEKARCVLDKTGPGRKQPLLSLLCYQSVVEVVAQQRSSSSSVMHIYKGQSFDVVYFH